VQGNWFAQLQDKFDLIVSNPPYIAEDDPHLQALPSEPRMALVSGVDGLDAIRHIIEQAPNHLNAGAWLLLEHGFDQAAVVCDKLAQRGFTKVQSRVDLAGIQRCSGGQWPEVK
jgi:release factor glutamine methyltransferase